MNKAHLTVAATHSNITRKQYERRMTMRSFWKHSLALVCSGLLLAAALPAFGAPAVTLSVTPASPQPIGTQLTLTANATGFVPSLALQQGPRYSFSAVLSPSGLNYPIHTGMTSHVTWTPPNAGDYTLTVIVTQKATRPLKATKTVNYHVKPQLACQTQILPYPSQAKVASPFSISAAVSGTPSGATNKFQFGFTALPGGGSGSITCNPNPASTTSNPTSTSYTSCTATLTQGSSEGFLPSVSVGSYLNNMLKAECWTHGVNYITVTP